MGYITEYSVSAFYLETFLITMFCLRKKYPCKTNTCYGVLLIGVTLATALDVISCYTIDNADTIPAAFNYLINTAYLIFFNLSTFLLYIYSSTVLERFVKDKLIKPITIISAVLFGLIVLPTPFTKLVITFDSGRYEHGPLFILLYIYSFALMVAVFVRTVKYRRRLSKLHSTAMQLFVLFTAASVVFQAFFPQIILQDLIASIFLTMIYMALQNPDEYMDRVTRCFNRNAFAETAERLTSAKTPFTLVMFTLEGFEQITQILGLRAADETIDSISAYLMEYFGEYNVYHLQGCRYAVVLDKKAARTLDETIESINKLFSDPYEVGGNIKLMLTPFICIIKYPEFEIAPSEIEDIMEDSFKKLAENHDLPYVEATGESLSKKKRENAVLNCLKQAIRNNSFDVYYQPIYSIKEKRFVSAEALVRLTDKDLGFLGPDEFIPLAEQNGMIVEIGEQIFRKVCIFIRNSGLIGANGLSYIEVNLSMVQCMQENMAESLSNIMDEYGVSPDNVNFEITETARFINEAALRKNMTTIINAGSSFSMDDYGTGFSTADYLISLPMKIVKIDKSILWPAMKDKEAFLVLKYTVKMLKELNKEIVVEGVETAEMARVLTEMGCDYLQGYLYSRPLPEDAFSEFIRKENGKQ